ncbi:MAG: hypothetical protein Q9174_005173 [Haloplaca sp. 1 TL-2023]
MLLWTLILHLTALVVFSTVTATPTVSRQSLALSGTIHPAQDQSSGLSAQLLSTRELSPHALSARSIKNVPGLPPGWSATYSIIKSLHPVFLAAPQLCGFYKSVVDEVMKEIVFEDQQQFKVQCGRLVLRFMTGHTGQSLVTRELIMATAMYLYDLSMAGFTELFTARLYDEVNGLTVFIQLKIV